MLNKRASGENNYRFNDNETTTILSSINKVDLRYLNLC